MPGRFIEELSQHHSLDGASRRLFEERLVNDLTNHLQGSCNTVFLMESPDKAELCRHHPLAGAAGATVTGVIIGAVGRILHDGEFDEFPNPADIFRRMGVMNVSRLPLQGETYDCQGDLCEGGRSLIDELGKIKTTVEQGRHPSDKERGVVDTISDDLRRRVVDVVGSVADEGVHFVACGNVAKFFLRRTCPNLHPTCIPHPSRRRGGWFEEGTLNADVQKVVNRLHQIARVP